MLTAKQRGSAVQPPHVLSTCHELHDARDCSQSCELSFRGSRWSIIHWQLARLGDDHLLLGLATAGALGLNLVHHVHALNDCTTHKWEQRRWIA